MPAGNRILMCGHVARARVILTLVVVVTSTVLTLVNWTNAGCRLELVLIIPARRACVASNRLFSSMSPVRTSMLKEAAYSLAIEPTCVKVVFMLETVSSIIV